MARGKQRTGATHIQYAQTASASSGSVVQPGGVFNHGLVTIPQEPCLQPYLPCQFIDIFCVFVGSAARSPLSSMAKAGKTNLRSMVDVEAFSISL